LRGALLGRVIHIRRNAYIETQRRQGGMSEPALVEDQDTFSADHEDEEVLTDEELEEEDEEL
jgi:hypothetical protein